MVAVVAAADAAAMAAAAAVAAVAAAMAAVAVAEIESDGTKPVPCVSEGRTRVDRRSSAIHQSTIQQSTIQLAGFLSPACGDRCTAVPDFVAGLWRC